MGQPPQGGGYPPQGGGYPPQGGGYPPQGGGYPPQGGGYPPQQQPGYPQQQYQQPQPMVPAGPPPEPTRSYLLTVILAVNMGFFGFDRFYLGKIGTGILKGVTFGGFGIWWFLDVYKVLANQTTDVAGAGLKGQQQRDPTILIVLAIMNLDRIYLGQGAIGFVKFFTFGGFGIWGLWDLYQILTGGVQDARGLPIEEEERKYQSVALLLAISLGVFGLDRHYLGHRSMAMLKFFTFGGGGMWVFLDIILIILNSQKDSKGQPMLQE